MSENVETTAPAGVAAENAAPASLSIEAAASQWEQAQAEQPEPEPAQSTETETEQTPTPAEAEAGDTDPGPAPADDSEPAVAGEPNTAEPTESEPLSLDKLDGRARIALRDGTTWTGKQLKERIAEVVEFDKRRDAFEAEFRQRAQSLQHSAQQAQLLSQILPQAISALEAQLPTVPPLPDPALARTDFIAYNEALGAHLAGKEARAVKEAELAQAQGYQQQQQARADQAFAEQQDQFIAEQRDALLSKKADLRDPAKLEAYGKDFVTAGKEAGFSDEEIYGVGDHRIMVLVTDLWRDAKKYRELQAKPPQPVKQATTAQTAPVAQPGRRVSGAEAVSVARDELLQKARNGGRGSSLEELARLYEQANS